MCVSFSFSRSKYFFFLSLHSCLSTQHLCISTQHLRWMSSHLLWTDLFFIFLFLYVSSESMSALWVTHISHLILTKLRWSLKLCPKQTAKSTGLFWLTHLYKNKILWWRTTHNSTLTRDSSYNQSHCCETRRQLLLRIMKNWVETDKMQKTLQWLFPIIISPLKPQAAGWRKQALPLTACVCSISRHRRADSSQHHITSD